MQPCSTEPGFPLLTRLRFDLQVADELRLPAFAGALLRSVLGNSLRQLVCVTGAATCEACKLKQRCVYAQMFETSANPSARYNVLPHPFVLLVPIDTQKPLRRGDIIPLELTLFGEAARYLPYLVQSVQRAGKLGLGRKRVVFELQQLWQDVQPGQDQWQRLDNGQPLPAALPLFKPLQGEYAIHLTTPFRHKRRGHLLNDQTFTLRHFLWALRERVQHLQQLSPRPGEALSVYWPDAFLEVTGIQELRWLDWQRYSARQNTQMKLGGLVGTVRVQAEKLGSLGSLLQYGQWVHVGKSTSMGLGCYRLSPISSVGE